MNSLQPDGIRFKEIERIFFEIGCDVSRALMQEFMETADKDLAKTRNLPRPGTRWNLGTSNGH